MIVVRIELRSAVRESRSRLLGTVAIANDGTGTGAKGNYEVTATRDGKKWYRGTVKSFPRRSRSGLELLRRALNAVHETSGLP